MGIIDEEQRVRLDRGWGPEIEGVVRVRGWHAGRTFRFGPVESNDGMRIESLVPTSVIVRQDGDERTYEIPQLRAGPPIAAFAIAPAVAFMARAMIRKNRKGR